MCRNSVPSSLRDRVAYLGVSDHTYIKKLNRPPGISTAEGEEESISSTSH